MKKIIATLILCLTFVSACTAEVITGQIRKESKNIEELKIDKTIKENPPEYTTAAILSYNQGIAYFNMGKFDKALEAFKKATKQDDRLSDAYFNLGIMYDYFNNTPSALIAFNRAYLTNKKDYESLYYVVKCYVFLDDKIAAKYYAAKIDKNSKYYELAQDILK